MPSARARPPWGAILATLVLALGAMLGLTLPVSGEIFRWTDVEGRLHFTERIDRVPPEHRAEARRNARAASDASVQTYSGAPGGDAQAPRPRALRPGAEIEIPFVRQGSLMRVEAVVNDLVRVPFLIDTGASGVSIPLAYANELGIRIRPDTEFVEVQTANGLVARPLVPLGSVQVGAARVEGLTATVNPGMPVGLLGGSFFNNYIYRVDAARSVMTLVPNENIRAGLGPDQWRDRFQSLKGPLERIEVYEREHPHLDEGERQVLTARRAELEASLRELELEANRLGVPHVWRY